jgi:ABC-type bacteriocin/lantibiotic exporter with double-glycine peptidase domain
MNATECGAACLAMILNYYGCKINIAEIRQRCGIGRDGLSALSIVKVARQYGLCVRALSVPIEEFRYVALPAVIYWEFNHFLVVERWSPKRVDTVDPAVGRLRLNADEFHAGFTGVVILFEPDVHFSRRRTTSQVSLWTYARSIFRLSTFLLLILGASLFLQVLGLIVPLLTKIFIDQVIPAKLENLMPILGAGIIIIVLMQIVTTLLRTLPLIYLQAKVDSQMLFDFFKHLLALPYPFFNSVPWAIFSCASIAIWWFGIC